MRHLLLFPLLALLSCSSMKAPVETGFLSRSITVEGRRYPYVVYIPPGYDRSRAWPVILFLHGAGERGDDGQKQTHVGIGAQIRANPASIPAIVVFPQVPADERWLASPADAAMAALDRTMAEYRADPARIYLTGLSMGGYGAWHLALAHPDRFAAAVVICGGLIKHATAASVRQSPLTIEHGDPYAFTAQALARMPIWMFHGDADTVIPVDESRIMAEALEAAGATFHYTEYAGVGHDSWDRAYAEPELWNWLFAQHR